MCLHMIYFTIHMSSFIDVGHCWAMLGSYETIYWVILEPRLPDARRIVADWLKHLSILLTAAFPCEVGQAPCSFIWFN